MKYKIIIMDPFDDVIAESKVYDEFGILMTSTKRDMKSDIASGKPIEIEDEEGNIILIGARCASNCKIMFKKIKEQ